MLRGYITLGGDCGCGGACCADGFSAWGLGAITSDEAAQRAMPRSAVRGTPGFTQQVYDNIVNAANTGVFNDYNAQNCPSMGPSATGARALSLVSTGSGMALTTAVQTGLISAGPATFGISIAIAGITALFSTIFNHHAQAVAREQRVLCASGPAANNYLQVIDQAVRQGLATPQQAIQALQSLLSDYSATVAPIMKNSSSACNAACVELKELTAIVAMRSSQYQDLANAQASLPAALPAAAAGLPAPSSALTPVAQPGPSGSAGAGPTPAAKSSGSVLTIPPSSTSAPGAGASSLPSWWPIAALALLGFAIGEFA